VGHEGPRKDKELGKVIDRHVVEQRTSRSGCQGVSFTNESVRVEMGKGRTLQSAPPPSNRRGGASRSPIVRSGSRTDERPVAKDPTKWWSADEGKYLNVCLGRTE